MIVPEIGLTGKREQALKEKLQAYKASLSKEEIDQTGRRDDRHWKYMRKSHLPRKIWRTFRCFPVRIMKQTSEPYKNAEETINGIPYLWHEYQTNGIVYLDLAV